MSMHWMGFDIYAMVKPKTREDVLRLLDEAHLELENINTHLTALTTQLEGSRKGPPPTGPQSPGPRAG